MMKSKYLALGILALIIILIIFIIEDLITVENVELETPGWAPGLRGLAITSDGKTAYISFSLDDSLLAVDLSDFTNTKAIDISSAGTRSSSHSAVLSTDESKLYVANYGTRNVMVINTKTKGIEKILPINSVWGDSITTSHGGTVVYITSSEKGELYLVNSSDYSYHPISIPEIVFESVEPSIKNPNILYAIGWSPVLQRVFFTFNLSSNKVERVTNLMEALPTTPTRFTINSNETAAYFGSYEMVNDKGVGNFIVFDLNSFQTLVSTPMDNGVTDFAVNKRTGKVYITGFWSGGGAPNKLPIIEYDLSTNKIVRKMMMSPSGDQRAIAIDPTNPNYLYMTEGDFNFIRKVKISTGKEIQRLKFNKEEILPTTIIRSEDVGYILSQTPHDIYKLNLSSGQLMGNIPSPHDARIGGYYQNKLYLARGGNIYSINPSDGSIIETLDIGVDINHGALAFFNDKMATIDYEGGGMIGKRLFIIDVKSMTIIKSIDLPHEPHGNKVVVSPDNSKFYISRGPMNGPVVITIFNASSFDVINTIEIPFIDYAHGGATGFLEYDFDETKRILYLAGFTSVYEIDMDTNKLIGILNLSDAYERQVGTGLAGVVLSSSKDKLFVISGDTHSMYTYDLVNSSWTKITNLKGYFITDTETSLDKKYLYTVNQKSDSITMVDLDSGDVVKIISLT